MPEQHVDGLNLGYVRDLLDDFLESPDSVDPRWRAVFEQAANGIVEDHPTIRRIRELYPEIANGNGAVTAPGVSQPDVSLDLLGGVAAAMALVKAHRMHGHLAARLDPLGTDPVGDPGLVPENLHPPLTPELQEQIPASVLRITVPGDTLAEALPHLRETYCGTMAYEIEHISNHEQRVWLRQAIESGAYRLRLSADEKRRLLARLAEVEGFERYLRRTFIGQKQFSIEGLDAIVPMLDQTIELAAASGAQQVVIGMAHRGRLNVLAHTVGRQYD